MNKNHPVEKILDSQDKNNKKQYLVQRKGLEEAKWEFESRLPKDAKELVSKFEKKRSPPAKKRLNKLADLKSSVYTEEEGDSK
jgi:hypothetical protein